MDRFHWDTAAQLIVWLAVGAALVAVAFYVVGKVRGGALQKEPTASQLMSKFRDLHSRGALSDAEFRTIKTTLATRFQDELRDSDETG